MIVKVLPIIPASTPLEQFDRFEAAIQAALVAEIGPLLVRAFDKRTAGWETEIRFHQTFSRPAGAYGAITIFPLGRGRDIWTWVSYGVAPRVILPRNAPRLVFDVNYDPHTQTGNVYGGSGAYSGEVVSSGGVDWPGIEAREFEKHIWKESEDEVIQIIERVGRKVLG